jgi:hypothetical protein
LGDIKRKETTLINVIYPLVHPSKYPQLLGFAKLVKLVFGVVVWGGGGFSLPKSGRPAFAEAASRRQAEVAPTHHFGL